MSEVELRKTFQSTLTNIKQLSFDFYSADEIRKMSVKEITKGVSFDLLGNPEQGGLYDIALGTIDRKSSCFTCGLNEKECPGHFGHFELEEPLYQPLLLNILISILRSTCLNCYCLKASKQALLGVAIQLSRLDKNDIAGALDVHQLSEEAMIIQKKQNAKRGKLKQENNEEEEDKENEENLNNLLEEIFIKEIQENKNNKQIHYENIHIHTEIHKKNLTKNFINHMTQLANKKCPFCGYYSPKIKKTDDKNGIIFIGEINKIKNQNNNNKFETTPSYIMKIVKSIWEHDIIQKQVLSKLFYTNMKGGENLNNSLLSYNIFFIQVLPIPPSKFRPLNKFNGIIGDNPQTTYYKTIIDLNNQLKNKRNGEGIKTENQLIYEIQKVYNQLILSNDSSLPPSIKSTLEHKEGLFRKNMMGKRVNYAARTVISPDPFIPTNTVGIPLYFAMKLTVANNVNERNIEQMKQSVINGPMVYPGAIAIEDEWGKKTILPDDSNPFSLSKRKGEANRLLTINPLAPRNYKIVYRHVIDNDMILTNRQPTLHKPGIMGHYVKVLKYEKTIRLHYANCSTFNADFDGDEMNIHLPQSILAKSEIMNIALSDEQYVVPKNGQPLRGLIQDHIISSFMLTKRNTFFNKEDFYQIIYSGLYGIYEQYTIKLPLPTILKPIKLWTGKQVISTILKHISTNHCTINFIGKCKVSTDEINKGGYNYINDTQLMNDKDGLNTFWNGGNDSLCIIKNSIMLTGTLDKNHIGASNGGLIHCIYELYNAKIAGMCLSLFSKLFTIYLQRIGHTCSLDDCLLTNSFESKRKKLLKKVNKISKETISKYFHLEGHSNYDISVAFSNVRRNSDLSKDLDNFIKKEVNECTSNVIKECIPIGQYRTFPENGLAFMTTTGAKGSKVNHSQITCLLGQQELEGRRVPIMCTGKTLPSFSRYDCSAIAGGFISSRFLTGITPQEFFFHCMAGREGLIDTAVKTANSGYLQRCIIKMIESLRVSYDYSVRESDGSIIQFIYGDDGIDVMKSAFLNNIEFWASNYEGLIAKYETQTILTQFKKGYSRAIKLHKKYLKNQEKYDPVLCSYSPANNLAACSEKYYKLIDDYIRNDTNNEFASGKLDKEAFRMMMLLRYNRAVINPGEAIGVIAAQSIGEPSTQMTLNTFHLAGRGDVNVTLGMPRIKELVMFAKKSIDTPSMILYLNQPNQTNCEKLAKKLTKVSLGMIVNGIKCLDSIIVKGAVRKRMYGVSLSLVDNYEDVVSFNKKEVMDKIKVELLKEIARSQKVKDGVDVCVKGVSGEDAVNAHNIVEDEKLIEKKRKGKIIDDDKSNDSNDDDDGNDIDNVDIDVSDAKDRTDEGSESNDSINTNNNTNNITNNITNPQINASKKIEFDILLKVNDKVAIVSVVEKVINKIILYECPLINRGIALSKTLEGKKQFYVMTEGVNLRKVVEFADIVDVNKIESNDVYAVMKMYGVEAGRAVLIHEIDSVFKAYGIDVDIRHLNLVGDYMTYEGDYKSFNRVGMENNPSPCTKMTFETSLAFLCKACLSGQIDNLNSPSSCIVVGKNITLGTGSFDVLNDVEKIN